MILNALILTYALALAYAYRRFDVMLYAGASLSYFVLAPGGQEYYLFACLFDLAVLESVRHVDTPTRRICVISVALNIAGYVLWLFYQPPVAYNLLFTILYFSLCFTTNKREPADDRLRDDCNNSCTRSSCDSRSLRSENMEG